jgi:soluble lytic murein transglycosylase-like protein
VLLWRPWSSVRAYVGEELGIQRVEALASEIAAAAKESGVDPDLVAAIVFMESRGRVDAVSDKDALGLMQLVSSSATDAAKRLGLPPPTREELLSDAVLNSRLGANHLAWLLENRGDWTEEQVLVAYNAGRSKLMRWMEDAGGWSAWCARERARMESGEPNTGALLYAMRVLDMRELFAKRGRIGG